MSRHRRGVAVPIALMLASFTGLACPDAFEPLAGLQVDVSPASTVVSAPIVVTLLNASPDTLYVDQCGARPVIVAERRSGSSWVQYFGGYCAANVAMGLFPLPPDSLRRSTLSFGDPGTYRLSVRMTPEPMGNAAWTPLPVAVRIGEVR